MSPEALLIIFVGVTAVALSAQSWVIWRAFRSVNHLTERAEKLMDQLENEADEIVAQVRSVAESLQPIARMSEDVQQRADALVQMFDRRSEDLDALVGELIDIARHEAAKVDEAVTDTVDKFEEATGLIQQDVLQPVVEISSFVKGMKTGLEYLLNRRPRTSAPQQEAPSSEEESFL